MYKKDLALNNLQWLICHKNQPNQTKLNKLLGVFAQVICNILHGGFLKRKLPYRVWSIEVIIGS